MDKVIYKHKLKLAGMAAVFVLLAWENSFAQVYHTYPRTAVQHFGKAPAEWYAKFDLVLVPRSDVSEARDIKNLNPNTLMIFTDEWTSNTKGMKRRNELPSEWLSRDSGDNIIDLTWGNLIDMSILCPKVNGKAYYEDHPQWLVDYVDLGVFDGIGSDWCWGRPHGVNDIDLDRNGRNDFNEHGRDWVDARWLEGVEAFLVKLRSVIGPDKLIWVNSGQFHRWGWDNANGLDIERQSGFLDWDFYWRQYQSFLKQAREPHVLLMDVRPSWEDPLLPDASKNHFKLMRFMLTATMLGDGYYNLSPFEAGEHHFQAYYDEFDLDLGYPTQEAQQLNNGCYVRFFDKGVSIVNPTGNPITLRDSDLRAATGYRGPYYRFRGGQDPLHNNGEQFSSVELWGGYIVRSNGNILIGDGIIMLTEPKAVVSDIMVDNIDLDTSPGSRPTKFTSGWTQTDEGDLFWNQNDDPPKEWYPFAYTAGGDGSQTATYIPNIGVAGKYEVYEWHGNVTAGQMASNAPYTITHSDGSTTKIVDQTKSQGRFNSLGIYSFTKGTSGKVVISNKANGFVVADMIIFVYRGDDGNLDTRAPNPPSGVRIINGG